MPEWQISACTAYDSIFWELLTTLLFKTDDNYAAGRLIRTSLFFSSELCDPFCYEIWCLSDKYQPVLHMIRFFGRYVDDNLLKTVEKYVAGRLIRTSLGLFQVLLIIFIMRYAAWMTNISLHCIWLNVFERYIDVNPFQTLNKYVAGRLIKMSLWLGHGLVICNVTAKSTKFTKDCYYALSLVIYAHLWSVHSLRTLWKTLQDII